MAFVGMKHVVAAPIKTEVAGQAVTYDTGVEIGAAISATVTINRNTEGLYANDALKESDNSITGGTIDLNIDDISDDAAEKILGVKKTAGESQTPTVFHETGEAAPYVGIGYYRVRRLNGVESYRAYWYHKTQLSMANETANTKAGSITFLLGSFLYSFKGSSFRSPSSTMEREWAMRVVSRRMTGVSNSSESS